MEKRSPASGNNGVSHHFPKTVTDPVFVFAATLLSLAFTFSLPGDKKESANTPKVRKAAVAGAFYPANKNQLAAYVDELLRRANPLPIAGSVKAILVPHAGYVYSGPVAAHAYKTIAGQDIQTVILMSNSHRQGFNGIAVYGNGSFETPLGPIEIDSDKTAKLLAANPGIMDRPDIHEGDHVLEVQLPFLQRTLKNFKIVPLLFGTDDPALSRTLADALAKIVDDRTLIVASSDMSHYPPYDAASEADRKTDEAILTGKPEALDAQIAELEASGIPNAETFLCGISGVRTAMMVAAREGANDIRLLKYANSGDTAGDKQRVVGYSAVAFVKPGQAPASIPGIAAEGEHSLTDAEQAELLRLAKTTVESYVRTRNIPPYTPTLKGLEQPLGAFVTLKEDGQLRGCIGRFEPGIPLFTVIQQMAVAAATRDPRFPPVTPEKLDRLDYEISVLSPLRKVPNADEIIPGKHGVEVRKGFFHQGVFLPQVATETGWSKEEFLSELCSQKAGLPRNCWKDPSVDLYVFTAQVFPEGKKE